MLNSTNMLQIPKLKKKKIVTVWRRMYSLPPVMYEMWKKKQKQINKSRCAKTWVAEDNRSCMGFFWRWSPHSVAVSRARPLCAFWMLRVRWSLSRDHRSAPTGRQEHVLLDVPFECEQPDSCTLASFTFSDWPMRGEMERSVMKPVHLTCVCTCRSVLIISPPLGATATYLLCLLNPARSCLSTVWWSVQLHPLSPILHPPIDMKRIGQSSVALSLTYCTHRRGQRWKSSSRPGRQFVWKKNVSVCVSV